MSPRSSDGMTVTSPPPSPTTEENAQALIEEARRRRNRRRRWWTAALLLAVIVAVVAVRWASGGTQRPPQLRGQASGSPPHRAPPTPSPGAVTLYPATGWSTPGILSGVSCGGSTCFAVGYSGGDAGDGNIEAIGTGNTAHLLVSTDGGSTWTTAALPPGVSDVSAVTCPSASSCVAVGQGTGGANDGAVGAVVLDSGNGGASWLDVAVPPTTLPLQSLSCASATLCAAVGRWSSSAAPGPSGFPAVVSTDGGRTWAAAVVPAGVTALSSVSCTSSGFCLAAGTEPNASPTSDGTPPSVVLASSDGGASWRGATVPSGYFLSGHTSTAVGVDTVACTTGEHCILTGLLEGTKSGDAFVTNDGGATWAEAPGWQSATGDGPGTPSSVSCPSPTRCVAFGMAFSFETATLLTSDDGGDSWQSRPATPGANLGTLETPGESFSALTALACPSLSTCMVVGQGQDGWLYAAATTDGGSTWSPSQLPVPPAVLDAVACGSTSSCLAVGATPTRTGLALQSTDGGRRWEQTSLPTATPPLDAVACPTTSRCVAVGGGGTGSASYPPVAISTADAGRSWNTVSLPDDVDPATLDCPGPTTCWVAGATGGFGGGAAVDVSHDNGRTWQPSSIPGDLPGVVAMSCSSPSDCVAVTVQAERASDPTLGSVVLRLVTASARGRWEKVGTIAPTWAPVGAGDTLAASPDLLRCQTGRECLLATASESGGAPQWRGRILRTTDGGRTWAVAGRSPDNDQSLAGVVCPGLGECVGVGSGPPNKGAGIVVTDGRGSHPVVGTVPAGVGNLYGVTCTSTERCVAVGTTVGAAAVLVTDDAGKSWSAATVPAYVTG